MAKYNTQANDMAMTANNWRIKSGALQLSSTNKRSRPEILGPRWKVKRDEVKQEFKRRSKELRTLEKKRGTTRMTRIESSRIQIDNETTRSNRSG